MTNTESFIDTLDGQTMSPRQAAMFAVTRAHGEAEMIQDMDLVMSALTDDAFWWMGNLNLRCEGGTAVREWYRRILPILVGSIETAEERSVAFGDDMLIVHHQLQVRFPDKSLRECPSLSIYYFRGDKVCGEANFCDEALLELYKIAASDDVDRYPGIRYLS